VLSTASSRTSRSRKGLELDWNRSTIIESPTIKAARLFYKGRLTPDSLAVAFREGWYYTWVEVSATRVLGREPVPAR
jgi:hypothetical protein